MFCLYSNYSNQKNRVLCSNSILAMALAASCFAPTSVNADGVSTPEEVQRDCMLALTPDEAIKVSVDDKTRCIQAIEKAMAVKNGGGSSSSAAMSTTSAASRASVSIPFISSISLKPKTMEMGLGFNYSQNINKSSLRTDRSRDISIPLTLTLGLSRKIQSTFSISVQNNRNEIATSGDVDTYKESGSGDSTVGLIYELSNGSLGLPSASLSLTYGIPTGKPADPTITGSTGTGSGYEYGSVGISLVKDSDPAVMFANFGYRHVFEREEEDYTVQPGATFTYGFGAGFSINRNLTLSGSFGGSVQSEMKFDGEPYSGTSREPVNFRTGLTYHTSMTKRLEGTLDYGLNDDAQGVSFDLMYLFSF